MQTSDVESLHTFTSEAWVAHPGCPSPFLPRIGKLMPGGELLESFCLSLAYIICRDAMPFSSKNSLTLEYGTFLFLFFRQTARTARSSFCYPVSSLQQKAIEDEIRCLNPSLPKNLKP
jgi:hypothetical protein